MEPAPFFADLADGPAEGRAWWKTTKDGVRVRIGVWPEGSSGTVLLFPGRSEYIEKYGRAAGDLKARGYATIAIDWRGQGIADRLLGDRMIGHVGDFPDFQHDLASALDLVRELSLPTPLYLIAHSMGGCIGLHALNAGLDVKAAVFSAPMWGIRLSPPMKPVAWVLSRLNRLFGIGERYAPGTGPVTYVAEAPFADNLLTTDPDMWDYMRRQVMAQPDLSLGGPSIHWVSEALAECGDLYDRPSPKFPVVTFIGSNDRIIDVPAVRERMSRWPGGRLEDVQGAEHELMMEIPATRARFFDAAAALFKANR